MISNVVLQKNDVYFSFPQRQKLEKASILKFSVYDEHLHVSIFRKQINFVKKKPLLINQIS